MDISISLTPDLLTIVNAKVDSGRYASTSDVVGAALRLLDRSERSESERIEALQRSWQNGSSNTEADTLDFAALREEARLALAALRKG